MAAMAVGACGAGATAQTISAVQPLAGGTFTRVYGVNSNGTAAAGYATNNLSQDVAIRWTLSGGTASMGFLPGGSINSYAQAINGNGTVLVGYGDSGGITRAFKWTTSGGYQILSFVGATSGFNRANAVSADGLVVVGTSGVSASVNGFTLDNLNYPNATSPFNLCATVGAGNSGLAVSADGLTIGGTCGPGAAVRTYVPNSVLGIIPGFPGQQWQMAEAVSSNGAFITGRYSPSTGGEFGYRYGLTVPGFVQALPLTPNGATALRPRAISGDGSIIVGQVVDNLQGTTGFAWTPATGTILIADHLQGRGVNLSGWTITDVTGISVDGTAMCGNGIFGGQALGWVARNLACPDINAAISQVAGCPGGPAQLQAFAVPPSGVTLVYRWFKGGVPVVNGPQPSGSTVSGAGTANLTFSNLQAGDAGSYQAGVSAEGACEVLSTSYSFGGPSSLTITNQPTSTTVCLGANPFFFAAATFPSGGVTFKWQKLVTPPSGWASLNDGPSGFGSTYIGTATTTFSVLGAQGLDTAQYRCVFNVNGCSQATQAISNAVQLTVIDSLPAILGPNDAAACAGANTVQLGVTVNPCNGCTFQWQKYTPCVLVNCWGNIYDGPTGNGGTYGGTQTQTMTLAGLYPGDFTQYRCIVTMPCAGAVASGEATVSVTPEASIASGPTVTSACLGGLGAMNVVANPPGSTYQWQRYVGPCMLCWQSIADGPTGNGGAFSGTQTPTLNISPLNAIDAAGEYRCVVLGPCGLTPVGSPAGTIATLQAAPLIQAQPVGGPICPNGTRQLSVTIAPGNFGAVTYQWWRYVAVFPIYQPVGDGTYPSGAVYSGSQTSTLTVSNFKQQDAGMYYCMVSGTCSNVPTNEVKLVWCPADFNCSGSLTVQDIFDFLSVWFAHLSSADFNNSGQVTVQDIFDFLTAWFAGCS